MGIPRHRTPYLQRALEHRPQWPREVRPTQTHLRSARRGAELPQNRGLAELARLLGISVFQRDGERRELHVYPRATRRWP